MIGAGHAGLATSRVLGEHSIDHVVLERGEIANSWLRERWDSLRLLTPNWQAQLPGYMVPQKVIVSDGPLPRNPNGKIDRKLLGVQYAGIFTQDQQ